MPRWLEIRARGPRKAMGQATQALVDAGSPGVEEAGGPTRAGELELYSRWEDETAEEAETSSAVTLKAYLPEAEGLAKLAALRAALKRLGFFAEGSFIEDADWGEGWKKGLRPIRVRFGDSAVTVAPTWHRVKRNRGEAVIYIDPGMAFGTGGHATTRMCLKALLMLWRGGMLPRGASFLDVGTGTGVLAIAAKKLGSTRALGIDIDPMAVRTARQNSRANKAAVSVSALPLERIRGAFDCVAANILSGELTRLARALASKIRPGGYLILSGILAPEAERVARAFTSNGLKKTRTLRSGEWTALVFLKTASKTIQ